MAGARAAGRCIIALVGSLADFGDELARIGSFGLALTVVAAAVIAALSARLPLRTLWSRLWSGTAPAAAG